MDDMKRMGEHQNFRLFDKELNQVNKIVKETKDAVGSRKYDNNSHFFRVAVTRLIRIETEAQRWNTHKPEPQP